jgi:DNA replication protein DnaD|tara:strand:- start:7373 stop:7987 length:615 start_codon:yes stop_codon:yes gene_type:complete
MSIQALSWCIKKDIPNPTAKLVLMILCNYANENNSSYPSEKHLAKLVGVSDRSIRRCTSLLSELGLLKIEQRLGTSNLYTLLLGVDTNVLPVRTPTSYNTKEDTKVNKDKGVDKYDQDFEDFWKSYPRRINKHLTHQKYIVAIKNITPKKLTVCAIRFANETKNNKTEEKFIPHPSTWLNQRRFLDYENQNIEIKKQSLNNLAG